MSGWGTYEPRLAKATLRSANNLGVLLRAAGQLAEAQPLLGRALEEIIRAILLTENIKQHFF